MASRQLRFYFPARTLILIFGEVGILVASFLLATVLQFREQTYAVLSYEYGLYKIAAVVAMGLLCMYYLDFYDTQRIPGRGELQFRVLVVVGTLSLLLGLLGAIFPRFMVGNYVFLTGLPILTFLLIAWRNVFSAMNGSERFMQRTLFLGDGDYSNSFWDEVKSRSALGLKLVGYVSPEGDPVKSDGLSRLGGVEDLGRIIEEHGIRRVVVTMQDRRGKLPVESLLELKKRGLIIEDASDF